MNPMRRATGTRRNDRCVCGSGKKYKYCCHPQAQLQPQVTKKKTHYIDTGESAVRYVICDSVGTSFFVDKSSRILVFSDRVVAIAVASLDEFHSSEPGEINVAGVGPTKWEHLQNTLPYVEVSSAEEAVALVRERIAIMQASYEQLSDTPTEQPNFYDTAGTNWTLDAESSQPPTTAGDINSSDMPENE